MYIHCITLGNFKKISLESHKLSSFIFSQNSLIFDIICLEDLISPYLSLHNLRQFTIKLLKISKGDSAGILISVPSFVISWSISRSRIKSAKISSMLFILLFVNINKSYLYLYITYIKISNRI